MIKKNEKLRIFQKFQFFINFKNYKHHIYIKKFPKLMRIYKEKIRYKIDFICMKNTYNIRSISFIYDKVGLVSNRFIDVNWNSRKSREML